VRRIKLKREDRSKTMSGSEELRWSKRIDEIDERKKNEERG
jgi:hypothetical protein